MIHLIQEDVCPVTTVLHFLLLAALPELRQVVVLACITASLPSHVHNVNMQGPNALHTRVTVDARDACREDGH